MGKCVVRMTSKLKFGMAIGMAGVMMAAAAGLTSAQEDGQASGSDDQVEFTPEFLADPEHIATGKAIWDEQCTHCHGAKAYPGKAPKLKPAKYKPQFVYQRVTKGFRAMPPWEDIYSKEERMAIVAYVKSPQFSP